MRLISKIGNKKNAIAIAAMLMLSGIGISDSVSHADNKDITKKDIISNNGKIEEYSIDTLSNEEKMVIDEAVQQAEVRGSSAGEILNCVEDDKIVSLGVEEILDQYYSEENVDQKKISDFKNTLNIDINKQLEAYENAWNERNNSDEVDYIVGEELFIFDKDTTKEEMNSVLNTVSEDYEIIVDNNFEIDETLSEQKKKRLKALKNYEGNLVVKAKLDLDQTVSSAAKELNNYACVIGAEKNYKCYVEGLTSELNDTYIGKQYYLDTCNFQDAWDSAKVGLDNQEIWIAVVDSGCNMSHSDLQGGLVKKYAVDITKKDTNGKYVRLDNLPEKQQYDTTHGTQVAGLIIAKGNNKKGIVGAARGWYNTSCQVMPIKVSSGLESNGDIYNDDVSPVISYSDLIKGIDYAIKSGAEVINVSISDSGNADAYAEVVKKAENAGVVVVACAGNANVSSKQYPAANKYVVAVGETQGKTINKKYKKSNYGSWVNIVAPATGIVSTESGNSYTKGGVEGTSYSTALVSATVGMMRHVNANLTPKEIRSCLYSSATSITSDYFQCGFLNAGFAVQKAKYMGFRSGAPMLYEINAVDGKKIQIQWTLKNVFQPERVQLYRSESLNGTYTKIVTFKGDNIYSNFHEYVDSTATVGKEYYYKIRCVMKYGDGYKYTPYSGAIKVKIK